MGKLTKNTSPLPLKKHPPLLSYFSSLKIRILLTPHLFCWFRKNTTLLCYSRHSSAATIDQLLKSPATYWIRSFTKSHCYKCYLLISAMEPNIINISISFHTRLNRNSTVTIHQKNIQILTTDSKTIKIFVHLYWMIFSTLRINHLETRINHQKPFSAYNIATCYTFPEKPLAVFKNKTKKWMTQKNSMKTLQKIYC